MRRWICLAASAALCAPLPAQAPLVLQESLDGYAGTDDNSMFEDRPDHTNGAGPHVFCGVTQGNSLRRGLIRFDLTGLPIGTEVVSAELQLVVDRRAPGSGPTLCTLHRALRAWGEGEGVSLLDPGLGVLAETGDATWLSSEHGIALWDSEGGDFDSDASASAFAGEAGTVTAFASGELTDDVRAWIADPSSNLGWVLLGDETGFQNARRFGSSEYGDPASRPRLTLLIRAPQGLALR